MTGAEWYLLGCLTGVLVIGCYFLWLIDRERRRPWWRS